MVVYFSGTGNSRYAASMIAHRTGDTLTDAGRDIQTGHLAQLDAQRPWVFVSPTYAWRIPHLFADYLRQGQFTGSRDAYFVMTCGADIGGAEAINESLAEACMVHGMDCDTILDELLAEKALQD